ncbi:MAG TPA: hypothetical protein VI423_10950 [Paenisporosarcina sp.]|nr:hypothetical protein [Paenisporosarcina sp.]
MLIENQIVEVKWSNQNKKYFQEKGYSLTTVGDVFLVKLNDLPIGTTVQIKAKCDFCGERIVRSRSSLSKSKAHYCSKDCEVKNRKLISNKRKTLKTCQMCPKDFLITKSQKDKKFCSVECTNIYFRSIEFKEIVDAKSIKITTKCISCHNDFLIDPCRFIDHDRHSCSMECKGKSLKGIKKKSVESMLNDVRGLLESKNCKYVDTPNLDKKKLINFTCNIHEESGTQMRTWSNILNVDSPCKVCINTKTLENMKSINKLGIYLNVLEGKIKTFPPNFFNSLSDKDLNEILGYYMHICKKENLHDKEIISSKTLAKYKLSSLIQIMPKEKIFTHLFSDKYQMWELGILPPNYWNDEQNITKARNWLINKLIIDQAINSEEEIILIKSHRYFKEYGLDGLLYSKFNATVFDFWDEHFNGKYQEWEYQLTKRNYWTTSENRNKALKNLIEVKLGLTKSDIPKVFTYGFLNSNYHKFSLICDSYYNSNLFRWIDEAYPNEFKIEQFTELIANDGTVVDSRAEKNIHNLLLENNMHIKYIENKQDLKNSFTNEEHKERYVPDWIINGNVIVEYYGWYIKNYMKTGNKTFITYNEKLSRKNEFYRAMEDYKMIALYPSDIENNFSGLIEKFQRHGIQLKLPQLTLI